MKKTTYLWILPAVLLLWAACKKEEPSQRFAYGSLKAYLLALPGASALDVYMDGKKVDTLTAAKAVGIDPKVILPAGRPVTIAFKKKGTDSLVVDTVLNVRSGAEASLTVAFSKSLGVSSFTSGSSAAVHPDSTAFFLYNGLPEFVQPNTITIDAYLLKFNTQTAIWEDTGISWPDLEKGKLNKKLVTLKYLGDNGAPQHYGIRIKDHATGNVFFDGLGTDIFPLSLNPGQRGIVTLNILDFGGGLYMFLPDYAAF